MSAQRFGHRRPKTSLMGAAQRCRHGIAVITAITILIERPGNRPFHPAMAIHQISFARKGQNDHPFADFKMRIQKIREPSRKMKRVFLWDLSVFVQVTWIALPADFHAPVEVGF